MSAPAAASAAAASPQCAAVSAASASSSVEWSSSVLDSLDCILFDCDGVLWHESTPISGAAETVRALHQAGKRILFVTNNSGKSRATVVQKLKAIGFDLPGLDTSAVLTSSQAAADFISSHAQFDRLQQSVFCIGEAGLGEEMRLAGVEPVEAMHMFGSKHLSKAELSRLSLDASTFAVVVGIDEQLTYTKTAYAAALLAQTKEDGTHRVMFVSTNTDSTLPTSGHELPGAGACVAMVATASGRTPINMGKPDQRMLDFAVKTFSLDRSRVLMVGDRLDTDIDFGLKGGIRTLFVTDTGIHSTKDIAATGIVPTYTAPDVNCMRPGKGEGK